MFLRLVYQSFRRQQRRKLLAGVSIALGVTVATAMIAVATDIGDKINRELRSYGANIAVTPQADTLDVRIGGVDLKPARRPPAGCAAPAETAGARQKPIPSTFASAVWT